MKYPKPPFKKYVKTSQGIIFETDKHRIEPSDEKKRAWEILYSGWILDEEGRTKTSISMYDLILATADTIKELEELE